VLQSGVVAEWEAFLLIVALDSRASMSIHIMRSANSTTIRTLIWFDRISSVEVVDLQGTRIAYWGTRAVYRIPSIRSAHLIKLLKEELQILQWMSQWVLQIQHQ
jgi:hypothetical protein